MATDIRFKVVAKPADLAGIELNDHVLGIEIAPTTAAEVRERCDLGIVDPQHTGGLAHCAALAVLWALTGKVELEAVKNFLAAEGTVWLITSRFDLDAAVAMALLAFDSDLSLDDEQLIAQVRAVDFADSFTSGKVAWPGPRPLPTEEEPWVEIGGAGEVRAVAAANWLTGWNFNKPNLSLDVIVAGLKVWLEVGTPDPVEFDDPVVAAVEAASTGDNVKLLQAAAFDSYRGRVAIAQALASGELKPESFADGKVAFFNFVELPTALQTTSTAGVGYSIAPVSTIYMKDNRTGLQRFTVACFNPQFINFDAFVAEVNALETGGGKWGGNKATGIIGAPMDFQTSISVEEFKALVAKHLTF